jgi:hypothetical protein
LLFSLPGETHYYQGEAGTYWNKQGGKTYVPPTTGKVTAHGKLQLLLGARCNLHVNGSSFRRL